MRCTLAAAVWGAAGMAVKAISYAVTLDAVWAWVACAWQGLRPAHGSGNVCDHEDDFKSPFSEWLMSHWHGNVRSMLQGPVV
jgi:hypothetical protein